jgi:hypothetical protein
MLLNIISKKWEIWMMGKYMDITSGECRDWNSNWNKLWSYQKSCFECDSNQFLDVDTLSCVTTCQDGQLEISNNQFNVGKIWRSLNFYVDPTSGKMLELGTKEYPYRSFKAVSSEILNQYSYLQINITIYLKEGIKIYIEDDTTYFVNLHSVTMTSYSDTSSTPGRALLVPTAIRQHGISKRAAFHLLNHTDFLIEEIISMKSYSDAELFKLKTPQVTLKISETFFSLISINAYREEVDYNASKFMMYLIYLQDRDVIVSKTLLV